MVNWAPGLGTVLANEEVTADGRSERGNFPVFRSRCRSGRCGSPPTPTAWSSDLDHIDWPEKVRTMQRNWIGRSTGAHVAFASPAGDVEVFTTRPDTLFGATYMVLAPEHPLVDALTAPSVAGRTPRCVDGRRHDTGRGRRGLPPAAVAPLRAGPPGGRPRARPACSPGPTPPTRSPDSRSPVFVADYVLMGYGTGAIMAVPARTSATGSSPTVFDLPIVRTVAAAGGLGRQGAYTGDGPADQLRQRRAVAGRAGRRRGQGADHRVAGGGRAAGRGAVTYRLRDWLFSRQRYWGEPFPIVYDETGLPIALPESMLPVELPETDDFSPKSFPPDDADSTPEPPLGRLSDWVEVELDLGDGPKKYRRETNTMPNWAGSCWYELRYLDPTNAERLVDPEVERYWMGPNADRPLGGVELYVGGVEHAVLHLLYARFWHKVLFDLGHVSLVRAVPPAGQPGHAAGLPAYTNERGFYVAGGRGRGARRPASSTTASRSAASSARSASR